MSEEQPPAAPAFTSSGAEKDTARQRILRLGFLALLAGGLLIWAQLRKPRTLAIELDLTAALPGEVSEVDLIVRRDERLLTRKDLQFDAKGAPQLLQEEVQATPGSAEVEVTVVYRGHPATRMVTQIALSSEETAKIPLPARID